MFDLLNRCQAIGLIPSDCTPVVPNFESGAPESSTFLISLILEVMILTISHWTDSIFLSRSKHFLNAS